MDINIRDICDCSGCNSFSALSSCERACIYVRSKSLIFYYSRLPLSSNHHQISDISISSATRTISAEKEHTFTKVLHVPSTSYPITLTLSFLHFLLPLSYLTVSPDHILYYLHVHSCEGVCLHEGSARPRLPHPLPHRSEQTHRGHEQNRR